MRTTSGISWVFLILVLIAFTAQDSYGSNYGPGFFNHSGCLYSYMEGARFSMKTADGDHINELLTLNDLSYDSAKSKCMEKEKPGKLGFSFKLNPSSKIKYITITMKLVPSPSEGYWEVGQANLTITRADVDRRRTFQLRVTDIYAGEEHSYSCNQLVLKTVHKKKLDNETAKYEPRAALTIEKFQVQPFQELENMVFGPSFDCATFFTVPCVMGLVLILFMSSVTIMGAIFLSKVTTNDFKFSKEGLLFTQSQNEANKNQ